MTRSTREKKTEETHGYTYSGEWKASLGEKSNERQLKPEEYNSQAFNPERL